MSWISRTTSSHNVQLGLTAVASGVFAACAVITFQQIRRHLKVQHVKEEAAEISETQAATQLTEWGAASDVFAPSKEDERSAALALRARQGDYDDELILEQLARNRVFLTDEGLAKVRSAFIIIVGCGGVGSHAAAALCRSGVSKIRLIDFDQVTLSSLNRHAVATLADVGTPKVHAIRKRLEQIAPWVRFDCRNELFGAGSADAQLAAMDGQPPDYIVDAIDNIDSKVALLHYCHSRGLRVVSSMGAGCKSDPSRLFVGDIFSTTEDPLSRATRVRLRLLGVSHGIPVVYSTEKPGPGKAELLPLPDDEVAKGAVGELSVLKDFRVRILPVLGTMPAIFGLALANHVMLTLADYPRELAAPAKAREKLYNGILGQLQAQEEKLARAAGADATGLRIAVTADDVAYLVEEVFRGRSVVSGLATRLHLVRWRRPEASVLDDEIPGQKRSRLRLADLVLMTKEEAARHANEVLLGPKTPEDLYDKTVLELVEKRLREEAAFERYR